jgi:hypothetical protein
MEDHHWQQKCTGLRTRDVDQVIECLLWKCKALSSNTVPQKKVLSTKPMSNMPSDTLKGKMVIWWFDTVKHQITNILGMWTIWSQSQLRDSTPSLHPKSSHRQCGKQWILLCSNRLYLLIDSEIWNLCNFQCQKMPCNFDVFTLCLAILKCEKNAPVTGQQT